MDAALTFSQKPAKRRRVRRVGGAVVVVIALLAVAAFAFFITRQTFANNTVSSGSLKVTSEGLPLDFGGKTVYPTTAKDPAFTVKDDFKVTNGNPVSVSYLVSATCSECGNAGARKQQFDNLYVRITPMNQNPVIPSQPIYEGRLADLKDRNLGTLAANASQSFTVEMWLADTGNEQTQNVKTLFELVLSARTPPVATPSGSPSPGPSLPLP
jgi:hypothetical protein